MSAGEQSQAGPRWYEPPPQFTAAARKLITAATLLAAFSAVSFHCGGI